MPKIKNKNKKQKTNKIEQCTKISFTETLIIFPRSNQRQRKFNMYSIVLFLFY